MQDARPDGETDATAERLVSQLAQDAQRRQLETQRAAQKEHPDFILDIEQSEVLYTLPPRQLPLALADYDALREALHHKWNLQPDMSRLRLDAVLQSVPRHELSTLSETELMQHVLQADKPEVAFKSGKYPISDFDFVPVRGVTINFESVLVAVSGISQVAEAVAAEVVEAVSSAAGATRPWGDVKPFLQRVGYATRTKVKLAEFESLLSDRFRTFLDTRMVDGPRLASHMGYYLSRDGLNPPENAINTYSLDDLTIEFARFDPNGGAATRTRMRFSVTAVSDFRTGVVSVSSELPYDVHVQCLNDLIAELERRPSATVAARPAP